MGAFLEATFPKRAYFAPYMSTPNRHPNGASTLTSSRSLSNPLRAWDNFLGSREYTTDMSTNRCRCQWTVLQFPRPRLDTSSGEQQFSDCPRPRGLAEPVLARAGLPWPNLLMNIVRFSTFLFPCLLWPYLYIIILDSRSLLPRGSEHL